MKGKKRRVLPKGYVPRPAGSSAQRGGVVQGGKEGEGRSRPVQEKKKKEEHLRKVSWGPGGGVSKGRKGEEFDNLTAKKSPAGGFGGPAAGTTMMRKRRGKGGERGANLARHEGREHADPRREEEGPEPHIEKGWRSGSRASVEEVGEEERDPSREIGSSGKGGEPTRCTAGTGGRRKRQPVENASRPLGIVQEKKGTRAPPKAAIADGRRIECLSIKKREEPWRR